MKILKEEPSEWIQLKSLDTIILRSLTSDLKDFLHDGNRIGFQDNQYERFTRIYKFLNYLASSNRSILTRQDYVKWFEQELNITNNTSIRGYVRQILHWYITGIDLE